MFFARSVIYTDSRRKAETSTSADGILSRFSMSSNAQLESSSESPLSLSLPIELSQGMDSSEEEAKAACLAAAYALFPDICPEFLEKTAVDLELDEDSVLNHILNLLEDGEEYPKRPRQTSNKLKRKREESDDTNQDDEEEVNKYQAKYSFINRHGKQTGSYKNLAKTVLSQEFPRIHVRNVQRQLVMHNNCLYPTYFALEQIVRDWEDGKVLDGYGRKRTATVAELKYRPDNLGNTINETVHEESKLLLEELRAARFVSAFNKTKRDARKNAERQEQLNFEEARIEGTVKECGCCFEDFAMNRMVHCNGNAKHWICIGCAKRTAETAIGLSKYELSCVSMDGCSAGFSMAEREKFLDDKLTAALDRIEYEVVLRQCGIENLETCPFCPYAAECLPASEDKEFRCENPDCMVVSCRLCRDETHIPKTCEEAARDHGISARRQIEEAMSAALIRKCNKCGTPFIKENGCNKMMCTRKGCQNVQCYVCSKSCDYTHFNDLARGGKKGNCPLFDSVEQRHADEVKEAEELARKKVVEENPTVSLEDLQFNMSDRVAEDDRKRKDFDPYHNRLGEMRRLRNGEMLALELNRVEDALQRIAAHHGPQPPQPPQPPPALLGGDIENADLAAALEARMRSKQICLLRRERERLSNQVAALPQPQRPRAFRSLNVPAQVPNLPERLEAFRLAQAEAVQRPLAARQLPARTVSPEAAAGPKTRAGTEQAKSGRGGAIFQAAQPPAGLVAPAPALAPANVPVMNDLGQQVPVPPPMYHRPQARLVGWLDHLNRNLLGGIPNIQPPFFGGGYAYDPINAGIAGMLAPPHGGMPPFGFGPGPMGMNYMLPGMAGMPPGFPFQRVPAGRLDGGLGAVQADQAGFNMLNAAAMAGAGQPNARNHGGEV